MLVGQLKQQCNVIRYKLQYNVNQQKPQGNLIRQKPQSDIFRHQNIQILYHVAFVEMRCIVPLFI